MKIIILMLLSLSIISCGTRSTETEKHETKFNENIETTKSGESNLKIDRNFESTEKQMSGKMQLSIKPNLDTSKHDTSPNLDSPCPNQRKVLVKDSYGNTAEMTLNNNEDIKFNSESNMSEKWSKYAESLQEYYKAKEVFDKKLSEYKSIKNKKTESQRMDPFLLAIIGVVIFIAGMIFIPLLKTFTQFKINLRS